MYISFNVTSIAINGNSVHSTFTYNQKWLIRMLRIFLRSQHWEENMWQS